MMRSHSALQNISHWPMILIFTVCLNRSAYVVMC